MTSTPIRALDPASADRRPLDGLTAQAPDPLLKLIAAHNADPRPDKIDVGVGVYRDAAGKTPVFDAVKAAERRLLETQDTKAYLGTVGDRELCRRLASLVFGDQVEPERIAALQTPGGTGALRLGFELLSGLSPRPKVVLGAPSWPVHRSILDGLGFELSLFAHADLKTQTLDFPALAEALSAAPTGSVVLLQAACHNPTGLDYSLEQWDQIAGLCSQRGLLPFIDCAYQGFGRGLEEDVQGLRHVLSRVDQAIVAYSCNKNFGLYRDRVGALFAVGQDAEATRLIQSNLEKRARSLWSMPPDHGGAVVRLILEDPDLHARWLAELNAMRARMSEIRTTLAACDPRLAPFGQQVGMFSVLPLGDAIVAGLAEEEGVYMAAPGRINIAGLLPAQVERFAAAILKRLPPQS